MVSRFSRPLAVIGLAQSGVDYAERFLRGLGLEVESFVPTPNNVDGFLKRGGLLIWIEAVQMEAEERRGVLRWRQLLDDKPNPQYAWRMAQVIIHNDGGLNKFCRLLMQLAVGLIYDRIAFMTRGADLAFAPDGEVGHERYQLLVLGAPPVGRAA